MTCVVCDKPDATDVLFGHPMHSECAPGHWKEDRKDLELFYEDIERRRPR